MKITDTTNKTTGNLRIVVKNETTQEERIYEASNLVTTLGKQYMATLINGGSVTLMNAIAVGTGTTTPTLTDTKLQTEVARQALQSTAVSGQSIVYTVYFPTGTISGGLTEAGIFNSTSPNAGTMMTHTAFPVVNVSSSDSMTITWYVTIN